MFKKLQRPKTNRNDHQKQRGIDMSMVHRIKCGIANCYIVSDGVSGILIDTGTSLYLNTIIDACKSYKIKLIILTHAHFDHIENAAALSEVFRVPIGMHKDDVDLIQSFASQSMSAKAFLGKIILSATKTSSKRKMREFAPFVLLEDGDDLTGYGITAKIIGLPGHTKGSIGIDIDKKAVIVGDALMNIFYPTVSLLYNDEKMMLNSAKKITELGERTVYFGHGKPLKNRVWVKEDV